MQHLVSVRTHINTSKQEVDTLRVSTAGDADGFVVDLQADGTGELALDALSRGCRGARAAAGLLMLLLRRRRRRRRLLRLAELGARRDKAPKHRHHGAGEDLQLSTTARFPREEAVQLFKVLAAGALSVQQLEYMSYEHGGFSMRSLLNYLHQNKALLSPWLEETCRRSKHWKHSSLTSVGAVLEGDLDKNMDL